MKEERKVYILFWTTYFSSKNVIGDATQGFNFGQSDWDGSEPFRRCENPMAQRCHLINNRSMLQQSDAIMFHIRDLHFDDMPSFRSPQQRWIFYLLESPIHTERNLENIPQRLQFNWTMTYRYGNR